MIPPEFTPDISGILALTIQIVLPLLVGLLTRSSTAASLKSIALLAATFLNQLLVGWYESSRSEEVFNWRMALWNVAIGFGISVVIHFGLWRPTGLTASAQNSLIKDPGAGTGTRPRRL